MRGPNIHTIKILQQLSDHAFLSICTPLSEQDLPQFCFHWQSMIFYKPCTLQQKDTIQTSCSSLLSHTKSYPNIFQACTQIHIVFIQHSVHTLHSRELLLPFYFHQTHTLCSVTGFYHDNMKSMFLVILNACLSWIWYDHPSRQNDNKSMHA